MLHETNIISSPLERFRKEEDMKKILFVFVSVSLVFLSCTSEKKVITGETDLIQDEDMAFPDDRQDVDQDVDQDMDQDMDQKQGCTFPELEVCSKEHICIDKEGSVVDTPSYIPSCKTASQVSGRPDFNDSPPRSWKDKKNIDRYYCYYEPDGAADGKKYPLLIWLHGGGGTADGIYNSTLMREKAESFQLSGDPQIKGFILITIQSRNLHLQYGSLHPGRHQDSYNWDIESPSTNSDIQFIDHIIDMMVETGKVDKSRIYLNGWSEGGKLSFLYGFARHETKTPGGSNVAAVAAYSSSNPFDRMGEGGKRCEIGEYPHSSVPILIISRTCDIIPCNKTQQDNLEAESFSDAINVEDWLSILKNEMQNDSVQWKRIDFFGNEQQSCNNSSCDIDIATRNHLVWPDGVTDDSKIDYETDMLSFLKNNPLK